MTPLRPRHLATTLLLLTALIGVAGCQWRGLNSLTLPGTAGGGPGSYQVQAQLPNVSTLQPNSRVRVADVTVGNVTKIEREGWHALVTMRLGADVDLPANATATLGQTSLLGTTHIELAPPTDVPAQGKLHNGSLIPLSSGGAYPTTEQTLAAISLLLNDGGIGRIQDITAAFSTAFAGREQDLKSLISQLDDFIAHANAQSDDIIAATGSLNNLVGQLAGQKTVLDNGLQTIPEALAVLKDERDNLAEALDQLGKFSAVTADSVHQSQDALVQELRDIGPVLDSLANAGPALTRSLSALTTFPTPKENLTKIQRGDYLNVSLILDLTLSRIDAGFFTGTRFEGNLTELEMQWGRTIGQTPSPYTAGDPLIAPYHFDQGP